MNSIVRSCAHAGVCLAATALVFTSAAAVSAQDPLLYDRNSGGFFAVDSIPHVIDDVTLTQGSVDITQVTFALVNLDDTNPYNVYAAIAFWDDFDSLGDPMPGNFLGSLVTDEINMAANDFQAISIDLITPLFVPDNTLAVEIDLYFDAGLSNPVGTGSIQPLLTEDLPTIGTTLDGYGLDDNPADGFFNASDGEYLDFVDSDEGLVLRLRGVPATVPEPSGVCLGIMGFAAVLFGMMRRKR